MRCNPILIFRKLFLIILHPLLPDWKSRSIACVILFLSLWLLPFVPGILRWLVLLCLPGIILWQACTQIQHGLWFSTAAMLLWWLLLVIVFLLHRTYDKGLFGKRR